MPTWTIVALGGSGCVLSAVLVLGMAWVLLRYWRYRAVAQRERSVFDGVNRAADDLQLHEATPGVYEGRVGPGGLARRLRCTLREVSYGDKQRLQLAIGTPIPTGALAVTNRTMVYGAEPEELELPLTRLGEAQFDVRFHVHADLEHLSILTPGVRDALLDLADCGDVRIRAGWLWLDHEATPDKVGATREHLDLLFGAAEALESLPTEVEQRVRRLAQDENPKVRAQTLELLAQRGISEFTTWIARSLLGDPDRSVQARAVELAGDTAKMVLLATDEKASTEVRRRVGRAVALVGSEQEKLAAAKGLAGGPMPLPAISVDLCKTVGADAEPVLIELVQTCRGSAVRSAVNALGQVGSARSMVVLQAIVDGAAADGVIRAEARVALDRLRANATRRKVSTPPFSATPTFTATPPRPPQRGEDTRIRPAPLRPEPIQRAPRAGNPPPKPKPR